jgi:uncharacterized lipoprotein YmbA
MKNFARLSVLGLLSSVLWVLVACNLPAPQADTARYFTLSGPAATAADGATVRPVQLAGHLRRREMAVRIAPSEIAYLEDVRWAESLDDAITQLLRARVGSAGAGKVITVQIERCELARSEGNSVQLAATWTIAGPGGDVASGVRHGSFTATPRTWDGRDYGALVGQIRDAVNELGDALAAAAGGK